MATLTHGGTLPNNSAKSDFYNLIDTASIAGIVNADIAAGAAIVDTKLAQITTANKVATSAITDGALNVAAVTCDSVASAGEISIAANEGLALTEGTAPSTDASEGKLYTKDTSGQPELFFREESDGDEVQITSGGAVTGATLQVKVGTFTRDNTAATGTQDVTGLGFTPKSVHFVCKSSNDVATSTGFSDGTTHRCIINGGGSDNPQEAASAIVIETGAGDTQSGTVSALASGQFTVSWTKAGTPVAGTSTISYIAYGV